MFEHCLYPETIAPHQLDEMLAAGWFRMGNSIFTTNYVLFNQLAYRTIWLRHVLKDYKETKTIKNLKKRNADFRIELKRAEITDEHEMLFAHYKSGIAFSAAASLDHLLHGYSLHPHSIYTTYEINLYDDYDLIGCSYFDIGHKTAEGISSFYNPEYKAYSLGKYLIYLQIEVCKGNNFDYFYPGYFVPGFPHLDYKLAIASNYLEFLDPRTKQWNAITEYEDLGLPLQLSQYCNDVEH